MKYQATAISAGVAVLAGAPADRAQVATTLEQPDGKIEVVNFDTKTLAIKS